MVSRRQVMDLVLLVCGVNDPWLDGVCGHQHHSARAGEIAHACSRSEPRPHVYDGDDESSPVVEDQRECARHPREPPRHGTWLLRQQRGDAPMSTHDGEHGPFHLSGNGVRYTHLFTVIMLKCLSLNRRHMSTVLDFERLRVGDRLDGLQQRKMWSAKVSYR